MNRQLNDDECDNRNTQESNLLPKWLWSFQKWTFVVNIVVQMCCLVFNIVTVVVQNRRDSNPVGSLLNTVLWLETVVQAVELFWYVLVAGLLISNPNRSIKTFYRYLDWVITTPTMLVNLVLLIRYFHDPSASVGEVVDEELGRIVVAVFCDVAMLCIGFFTEIVKYKKCTGYAALSKTPEENKTTNNKNVSKYGLELTHLMGFSFFIFAFLPSLIAAINNPSTEGWIVWGASFGVWSLYGVTHVCFPYRSNAHVRNGCYNVLDILSKNAFGIVVSAVALHRTRSL
jgi:hypothetical protein